MVPWDRIADFIIGDYENQVQSHRRLRSNYESQIRRLIREEEVRAIEHVNVAHIPEAIYEAHLDADDKIKQIGDLVFGEYEFRGSTDAEKQEVESEMKKVVKACNRQIWKYKIISFSRGILFLVLVTVVGVIGLGSLV